MWEERIQEVLDHRRAHREGGGEARVQKQHDSGKLTVWERLRVLLDEGSFVELNANMESNADTSKVRANKHYPGDGVVAGWGRIDGRRVCVAADDFTVIGGTMGAVHARRIAALQDFALRERIPIIFLNDSGGARIEEGIMGLSGYGEIFRRHIAASGVVPQICAILGPCSGGASYSPALCDFIFAVKGMSRMFITGPDVVESVLGTRPTMEELGGADMHASKSGVVHALYDDETACLMGIRTLLSYLPENCFEAAPVYGTLKRKQAPAENTAADAAADPQKDGVKGLGRFFRSVTTYTDYNNPSENPAAEKQESNPYSSDLRAAITEKKLDGQMLRQLVPDNARRAYDVKAVIAAVMDDVPLFEIQGHFAPNIVVGFGYLDGKVTGVIANQPLAAGGSLDVDASDKCARFIRFCDAFNIPLLTFVDVPAFLPGVDQEQKGIIRHGAKIIYAYSDATVPKITVILRKAYGGAYIAMNSRSIGADMVFAWPIAEIAVMGAEGAVRILHKKDLKVSDHPADDIERYKKEYEDYFLNPSFAEKNGFVDEVILPEETRERVVNGFRFLGGTRGIPTEGRKHGNIPL